MEERELGEKCAVFGILEPKLEVSRLTYYGLYALQHRGQESSGIVTTDGKRFYRHTGQGLVGQVYRDEELEWLHGTMAVGHNRYSTSGGSAHHTQPILSPETGVALAHNGNLPSTTALQGFLNEHGIEHSDSNDSEMMAAALTYYVESGLSLANAVEQCYQYFTGAFACVAMSRDQLVGFRDACGVRPLSVGRTEEGWVLASETCAFDTIGAAFIREVEPGEMVVIDRHGLRARQLAPATPKLDVFEFVYFARPDSLLAGRRVGEVRRAFGKQLWAEHPLKADVVIPVPDSAIPAALGYAGASGIPFDHGLIKNRYIHRTFIRPSDHLRQHDLGLKLNPVPEVLMGKHVVVVDDSIVRGNTTRKLVRMLYGAGAHRVSLLISSPPFKYPDFYGIDTPRQTELIAAQKSIPEIQAAIGCDYLGYLSYDGMVKATGMKPGQLTTSVFNGVYPIDIKERAQEFTLFK
ncbi:MAG TPA: amidophosphoribosyltransferase [Candidatus Saccharimonadales bacterium]|nr:amidophosphoribosyltransferase [Candidatus Saccharimonadales bacterium]